MRHVAPIAAPLLAGLIAGSLPGAALAQVRDTAVVAVTIRVTPVASIEFPDGFEFVLTVPDHHHGHGHGNGHGNGHNHGHGSGHDKDHGKDKHDDHGKNGSNDKHGKDSKSSGNSGKKDDDKGKKDDKKSSASSKGKHDDKGKGGGKHDDKGGGRDDDHDHHDHDHDDHHAGIKPVLIPFKVRGNATASISVIPVDFMKVYRGPYLGAATGPQGDRHRNQKGKGHSSHGNGRGHGHGHDGNDKLGYNAIVQFPLGGWHLAHLASWQGFGPGYWSGFASLPGLNGVGTPPLSADLSLRRHGAFGMIYIVSKSSWTIDGKYAAPGNYRGEVQVTLTADD